MREQGKIPAVTLSIFRKLIQQLKATGWGQSATFWVDSIPLAIALPFLLFPQRAPILTAISLAGLIVSWLYAATQTHKLSSPLSVTVICLGSWSILAILVSADPDLTVEKAAGLILGLAVWRWVAIWGKNQPGQNILLFGYLIIGTGFTGIGFLSVDWLDKIPALTRIINIFPQQVISLTAIGSGEGVQPNQLAGTLLWLFPISTAATVILLHVRQRFLAVCTGLLSLLFVIILILSQSRGGWLGGLATAGSIVWLAAFTVPVPHWYSRMRWGWPAIVIGLIAISFLAIGPTGIMQIWVDPPDTTAVGDLGTLSFRQEVWTWALQAIQDFAFTGTGLGSFRTVVHRLYPIAIPVTEDIAHAHNVFLQIALDTGLPGLTFYLAMLCVYGWMGWSLIKQTKIFEVKILAIGLLASQIGFHTYGLLDTISLGAKPGLLFWLQIALMTSVWRSAKEDFIG